MLFRVAQRKSVWEEKDPAEVVKVEFRDRHGVVDLRPSVYEAQDTEQALQCCAEHAGSFLSPTTVLAVEFSGGGAVVTNAGTTFFAFSNEQHREVVFHDEVALTRHVATVLADVEDRRHRFTREEVKTHVAANKESAEWQRAFDEAPHGERWRRLVKG